MNYAIIMMAGSGTRFGAPVPKQYVEVEERPLFSYIIEKYYDLPSVEQLVIVAGQEWIRYIQNHLDEKNWQDRCLVVSGGRNRSESVRNGLRSLEDIASPEDIVLIHDVTHPIVDVAGIRKALRKMEECEAVTLIQREYDTVYRVNEENQIEAVEPREQIVSGASPEVFRYGPLSDIYKKASTEELAVQTSVGAMALSHGIILTAIESNELNLKITMRRDMALYRTILRGERARKEEASCCCTE